jgi:DNA-binding beta-propeller fold protein YncE
VRTPPTLPTVRSVPTSLPRRSLRAAALATAGALAVPAAVLLLAPGQLTAQAVESPIALSADDAALRLAPLGSYSTGVADESAAEIVAHHPGTQQLFVVNAQAGLVDVLDVEDPATPALVGVLDPGGVTAADGSTIPADAVANSVTVRADGLLAVAMESDVKTEDGWLAFFDATDADRGVLGAVRVGPLPDMVTFTPDGARLVVANEGEPADDYSVDPEGSVSVVEAPTSIEAPEQDAVRTAAFHDWEEDGPRDLPADVRVFGPVPDGVENPVSANLEPEYAAISGDSATAYVTLQENNAIAVVDLATAEVTDIHALGFKDHSAPGNGLDASDRDGVIDIRTWPVYGIYMPDALASYEAGGETFLVTANEGDAREWGEYVEPARAGSLGSGGRAPLCADARAAGLTTPDQLGRLTVSLASGLSEDGSCYDELYAFGARSFSIWTADGEQVFDSGDEFERVVAEAVPEFFNSNHSESNLEGRSDDKGPEPEGVAVGEVDGRTYAFIGFERVGGVIVYDVTDPGAATFVTYVNNRDFAFSLDGAADTDAALAGAGDLGPEGLTFIPAADSPSGEPLLAVASEVSGTTTLFAIALTDDEPTTPPTSAPPTTEPPTTGPSMGPTTGPTSGPTTSPTSTPTTTPTSSLAVSVEGPVRAGTTAVAVVTGGTPGEELSAMLRSTPVDVGPVTLGAAGTGVLSFVVPADTAAGPHTLEVVGASGTASVTFEVLAADGTGAGDAGGPGPGLADTGPASTPALIGLAALALLTLTGGALLVRRARALQS